MTPLAVYKIVPGERGGPAVYDVSRDLLLFPDRVFPSEQVAVDALRELAKDRGWKLSISYTPDGRVEQIEAHPAVERIEAHPASVRLELDVTPEFDELLATLARELKGTKGKAILKGLALLQIALEAKREGKRLAVVDDRDNTEEDINEV